MDGGNFHKFLGKLEKLQPELPANLHPVLQTLKLFKSIVDGCFSHDLCSDFKERIKAFKVSYKKLMIYSKKTLKVSLTVTWKLHCVTAHLQYVLNKQQKGMAQFAEQTGEAAHHKMKPVLSRHGRTENHREHGTRQLAAVTKFASWNLKYVTQIIKKGKGSV